MSNWIPKQSEENRRVQRRQSDCSVTKSRQQSRETDYTQSSVINVQGAEKENSLLEVITCGESNEYGPTRPGHTDNNSSTSSGTYHRSVRGRGRGQVRACWEDSTDESHSGHNPSKKIKDEQHEHISSRYIGRGRARGRSEDTSRGTGSDHSVRITHQQTGRSSQSQGDRDTATGDHQQGSSDLKEEAKGQWGREVEHRHGRETQEQGRKHTNWKTRNQDRSRGDGQRELQQKTEEDETSGNVCQYCGDSVSKEEVIPQDKEVYHKKCLRDHLPWCQKAVSTFRCASGKSHVLYMAAPVQVVYGGQEIDRDKKKKRELRDLIISELLNKAAALRNSNSGYLLIHLIGLNTGDKFTGAFDEFADVKLQGLINDGSLFDDVYKKSRLSDHRNPGLKKFTDILVLYVAAADVLTTSDYKTKVALDDCIIDIPDQTLLKFLKDRRVTEGTFHKIPAEKADDLCDVFESRHIQTKAVWEPETGDDKLVLHIFTKLRAAEYISAFSKNKDGGSYLLGIAEKTTVGMYRSKVLKSTPVHIEDCEVVSNLIINSVSETCLVCDYLGKEQQHADLVNISFIPSTDSVGYVIHISIRSVNGIVFYDKSGPEAYRIGTHHPDENSITRLSVAEWFKAFRLRLH